MQIEDVNVGIPTQVGTELFIRVMPFDLGATTGSFYYEVRSSTGAALANGNYAMSEAQFALINTDTTAAEDVLLTYLGLTRAV